MENGVRKNFSVPSLAKMQGLEVKIVLKVPQ